MPPPTLVPLLTAQGVFSNGAWRRTSDYDRMSVETSSMGSGSVVQVWGSLLDTEPGVTTGFQIGGDITTSLVIQFEGPINWVRASFNGTGGVIDVRLLGFHRE